MKLAPGRVPADFLQGPLLTGSAQAAPTCTTSSWLSASAMAVATARVYESSPPRERAVAKARACMRVLKARRQQVAAGRSAWARPAVCVGVHCSGEGLGWAIEPTLQPSQCALRYTPSEVHKPVPSMIIMLCSAITSLVVPDWRCQPAAAKTTCV